MSNGIPGMGSRRAGLSGTGQSRLGHATSVLALDVCGSIHVEPALAAFGGLTFAGSRERAVGELGEVVPVGHASGSRLRRSPSTFVDYLASYIRAAEQIHDT